jgi:hypothetical protein
MKKTISSVEEEALISTSMTNRAIPENAFSQTFDNVVDHDVYPANG